jgi:peptidoglycan/LPS O-acetylase OafA/YrhL
MGHMTDSSYAEGGDGGPAMRLVVAWHPGPREPHPTPNRCLDAAPASLQAGPGGRRRLSHVPALDGVRALAVIAVLCFHGGVSWMPGGFLGVDAFFVLSGYLITILLVEEWQRTGHVDLVAFWGRRARRLLPALLAVVLTVGLAGPALLPPEDVRQLRGAAWASLLYVNNWRMVVQDDDYFDSTAAPSPLEHTWSLAIEEQFYLLWPLVLVLVLRGRVPLRGLLLVCLLGAALSAGALAAAYQPLDLGRAYYGTDTRGASLLLGAALAAALAGRSRRNPWPGTTAFRRMFGVAVMVATAATAWAWTHLDGDDPRLYRGGMTVAALAVALVLAHVALVPGGTTARVLSVPPLPALGLVSYGVYLWHWPIFLAVNADRTGLQGTTLFGARCLVTVVVATASFVLLEQPVRRGVVLRRASLAAPAAVVAVASCAVLVATLAPAPAAVPVPSDQRAYGGGLDALRGALPASERLRSRDRAGAPGGPARSGEHVHRVRPGGRVVVDVFGDSVAWSMATALPTHPRVDLRDRTLLGCGVTLTAPYRYFGHVHETTWRSCRPWAALWRRAIARDDPDVALVLVGRWETMDRVLDGRWTHIGEPAFDAHLRERLQSAVSIAGAHGARVLLATHPYNRRGERLDGGLFPEDRPERVTAWNRLLRGVAAANPGVSVLDLGRRITPDGRFSWTVGGHVMRTDGLHLAPDGVRAWIAPWLYPRLISAAQRPVR